MVRFIIELIKTKMSKNFEIYIPIWLDLLCESDNLQKCLIENLHSNMVRFIIRYI